MTKKTYKDMTQADLEEALIEQRRCLYCGEYLRHKEIDNKFCDSDCRDDYYMLDR